MDGLIKVTDKAAAQLKELMKTEDGRVSGIRIKVFNGGCSGLRYQLAFETTAADEDEVVESNGIKVFLDPDSIDYIRGVELDYGETVYGPGFRITNPKAMGGCGCR